MPKHILVCGGAGYIGSHMVRVLADNGYTPVIFDDLSTGHADAVKGYPFIHAGINDSSVLADVFSRYGITAVMHFAARSLVGESMEKPYDYYLNNVAATVALLEAMHKASIRSFIFSSSAAVYGQPGEQALAEDHPCCPINPYGRTKLMVEHILSDAAVAYGLSSVSLRYFNAAGAHTDGSLGERHNPETHLIPNILTSVLADRPVSIFGDDYATPDGTCIRDYIHVLDLCDAHLKALAFLESSAPSFLPAHGAHVAEKSKARAMIFNLGSGQGYSIKEILNVTEKTIGKKVAYTIKNRRAGDPAKLVAVAEKAKKELGFVPRYSLNDIIQTAWAWHSSRA